MSYDNDHDDYGEIDDDYPDAGAAGGYVGDAETLLRRAIDIVSTAPSMPLSSSPRIDRDEIIELLEESLHRLPDELRQARWMLKERQDFVAKTRREADELLEAARVRAERMVQRTEVVRAAEQSARSVLETAEADSRRLKHETEDFLDQRLGSFEILLDKLAKTVHAGRQRLSIGGGQPEIVDITGAVGAIDLDGDGKKDLVVTDLEGDRLNSFVLLRRGDGFEEIPGSIPYYLAVLQDWDGKTVVAGQRKGGAMRMFLIYSEGNFIEATEDTPFLQIGEHKYGKPILDRVVRRDTSLADAQKAVLLSMDSTLRSNLSVGMPLDLCIIRNNECHVGMTRRIEAGDESFRAMSEAWSQALRDGFAQITL